MGVSRERLREKTRHEEWPVKEKKRRFEERMKLSRKNKRNPRLGKMPEDGNHLDKGAAKSFGELGRPNSLGPLSGKGKNKV